MSLFDAFMLDPHPFEVWIAYRTDGLTGSGTLSDPWDGSTAEKLDALLNGLPSQTRIHLGPSPCIGGEQIPFQTRGYADGVSGGWQPQPGLKIFRAGLFDSDKFPEDSAYTGNIAVLEVPNAWSFKYALLENPGADSEDAGFCPGYFARTWMIGCYVAEKNIFELPVTPLSLDGQWWQQAMASFFSLFGHAPQSKCRELSLRENIVRYHEGPVPVVKSASGSRTAIESTGVRDCVSYYEHGEFARARQYHRAE